MKYILTVLFVVVILSIIGFLYLHQKRIREQEAVFRNLAVSIKDEPPRSFPDSSKMSSDAFWKLIEKSKKTHPKEFYDQMEFLTETLASFDNEEIVGFERTLREELLKSWNYNVKSLFQIMYGDYFSNDKFLHFRCWLLSNGKDFYYTAINNPEGLVEILNRSKDGRAMLAVADNAFVLRNGDSSKLETPSHVSMEVDYGDDSYKMTGEYVDPIDFKNKFPKLITRF